MWKGKLLVKSHVELVNQFPVLSRYESRVFVECAEAWINEVDGLVSTKGYEVLCWSFVSMNNQGGTSLMVTLKFVGNVQ